MGQEARAQAVEWQSRISTVKMARLERFELPTPWFVAKYSIQLSYRRAARGLERGP